MDPSIVIMSPSLISLDEVLNDLLPLYDWLHLHHEDFTGQYGKFYASFQNASWYKEGKKKAEQLALSLIHI